MTDAELLDAFEAGRTPPGGFHHADHVRVAWCYLRRERLADALDRFRRHLRRFAAAQGAPERYHETITTAYVLVIADRLASMPEEHAWEDFALRNPDVLSWKPSILDRHYRAETLASAEARDGFVPADRTPLARPARYPLVLRLPREDEEQEFLRAHRATTPDVPNFLHYYEEGMPFPAYLRVLEQRARGVHLPPGHVPSTFLFAFDASRIVGRVSIRHELNEFLLRVGGHIGYAVVPEFRRRGFATEMLRQAVEFAHRALNINRVLLTCDDDNVGSIRTIEKNGGILEDMITGPDLEKPKRRYWIDTTASS